MMKLCNGIWQLDYTPLCPFSRTVRLVLNEKRISYRLCDDDQTQGQPDAVHRFCQVPVLRSEQPDIVISGNRAICEFLEETEPFSPILIGSALERAEIRRMVAFVDEDFYAGVTLPILAEHRELSSAPVHGRKRRPLPTAMWPAEHYLCELDYLLDTRRWLAGSTISLADFAAAAHISVADYLGGIDWTDHQQTRDWYAGIKSRRTFAPLLAERVTGIEPPRHYAQVDF